MEAKDAKRMAAALTDGLRRMSQRDFTSMMNYGDDGNKARLALAVDVLDYLGDEDFSTERDALRAMVWAAAFARTDSVIAADVGVAQFDLVTQHRTRSVVPPVFPPHAPKGVQETDPDSLYTEGQL